MSSADSGDAAPRSGRILDDVADLDDRNFQLVLAGVLRTYVERNARAEGGLQPFDRDALTATEVVLCVNDFLEASGLELVDLSVWHGLGIR